MPSSASRWGRFGVLVICLSAVLQLQTPVVATGDVGPGSPTDTEAVTACAVGAQGPAVESLASDALSITTFVAPGEAFPRLVSGRRIRSMRDNGTLVPASRGVERTWTEEVIAYRDTIVHRVRLNGTSTGLASRLDDRNGSPTSVFHELVTAGAIAVEYYGATACPPELALNASIDRGAIRVVPDARNDTLYVVLDTDRLLFHPLGGGQPTTDTRVKGTNRFVLTLRASGPFAARDVSVANSYHVAEAAAEFDSRHRGLVTARPAANRTLRGQTTLAPGTELTVLLHPYVANTGRIRTTTSVTPSRRFSARFDLSNVTAGALYVVEVPSTTEGPVIEGGATLLAVGNATGAIVTATNQTSDGTILYGPSMTTTHGGFVVVRNASGRLIGVSDYHAPGAAVAQIDLVPPVDRNRTLTVTVYRDRNGNEEFDAADSPYRVNGSVVRDTVRVGLDTPRATATVPTSNHTRTASGTRSTEATTAEGPRTTRPTTDAPGPAAGDPLVVAALLVLIAGALTVRRRY